MVQGSRLRAQGGSSSRLQQLKAQGSSSRLAVGWAKGLGLKAESHDARIED